MNTLIKPQKPSYAGEDSQVVAYSLACEIAGYATICAAVAGIGAILTLSPVLAGITGACVVAYVISSAACHGYI